MQRKTERKMCGTCEYWSGKREPTFDKKGITKINIEDRHGICNRQEHRFADENRRYDLNCSGTQSGQEFYKGEILCGVEF